MRTSSESQCLNQGLCRWEDFFVFTPHKLIGPVLQNKTKTEKEGRGAEICPTCNKLLKDPRGSLVAGLPAQGLRLWERVLADTSTGTFVLLLPWAKPYLGSWPGACLEFTPSSHQGSGHTNRLLIPNLVVLLQTASAFPVSISTTVLCSVRVPLGVTSVEEEFCIYSVGDIPTCTQLSPVLANKKMLSFILI